MDRIAVVGVAWRQEGRRGLDLCTVADEERADVLPRLAAALGTRELVYLATCNRVEVAFAVECPGDLLAARQAVWETLTGQPTTPGESARHLRAWAGEGAVEHLFLVAAGLDSARVGETEIAGQLRRAIDRSQDLDLIGPRLGLVGREALKLARRIHRDTNVQVGRTSLAEIAMDFVRGRVERTGGSTALVGVSPMTERCALSLRDAGLPFVVVNRTPARAHELCSRLGAGEARDLAEFRARPDRVEALVLATGSPDPVLDRATLERLAGRAPSGEPPLVVDLAIPPDVDPADAAQAGVRRIDMDTVNAEAERTRHRRLLESADARVLVDEALDAFRRRVGEHALAPLLAALHRRYRHTASEGVERLLRKLDGLGDDERRVVREWAGTLAARFAHIPTQGLRSLAAELGPLALHTFFDHADEALMRELGDIAENEGVFATLERNGTGDDS